MRCIIITGTETSGTSCVAGMTHRIGINMGFQLKPPSKANPKGYYEDVNYQRALYVRGGGGEPRKLAIYGWALERVSKEKENGAVVWGFKEPWFMTNSKHTFNGIRLVDPEAEFKIVHMRRDKESIARSRMNKYYREGLTLDDYLQKVDRMLLDDRKFFESFGGPVFDLSYEQVLSDPTNVMAGLVNFYFEGIPECHWPSLDKVAEGEAFVDPSLQRF